METHTRVFGLTAVAAGMVLALATAPAGAAVQVLLMEDFESDTPDTQPASADGAFNNVNVGTPGMAQIGVTGGIFADPFDPGNNQSMVLSNPQSTSQLGIFWNSIFDDDASKFRTGTIEFDLYMESIQEGDFWSWLGFRSGFGNDERSAPTTIGDLTAWTSHRIQDNPNLFDDGYFQHTGVVTNEGALDVPVPDQSMHVVYEFDGDNETYRLTYDGVPVDWIDASDGTTSTGIDHPWVPSIFQGGNPGPGVNMFAFFTAAINPALGTTEEVYIDNLVVTNLDAPDVLLGDANKDGQVTGADLISVQQNFGNVGATPLQGDANNDGQVTGADLISVQQNFGNVLGPAATPEPTTLALLGLAGLLVAGRRQQR